MQKDEILSQVRKAYGNIARGDKKEHKASPLLSSASRSITKSLNRISKTRAALSSSCCSSSACGCGIGREVSRNIGYSAEELNSIPQDADLGLGCGNPTALASLKEGEWVLDLGSGAGIDCFLAANRVGPSGRVIGVDMTPEMIERARQNARKQDYRNVEFRLGEIENLPLADSCIDVAISNCVINLTPDKGRAFHEIFRVLKPGGRMIISDIVLTQSLPEVFMESIEAYVGCVSGALPRETYIETIRSSGLDRKSVV